MNNPTRFAKYCSAILIAASIAGPAVAAPYGPKGLPIDWVQPNGAKLKLRVFGDEFYGRTETENGFTVVYDKASQTYQYAKLSANGKNLVSSGRNADLKPSAGLSRRIDLPKAQTRAIIRQNRLKFDSGANERWNQRVKAVRLQQKAAAAMADGLAPGPSAFAAGPDAAPVNGDKRGLTILVQFPNDKATAGKDPVDFPTTRQKIARYCNEDGYNEDGNTGSIRDYFYDQSLGTLTYTQKVTPVITLPEPRDYYNYSDYPANQVVKGAGAAGRELIRDAIQILKARNFDFSGLSVDGANNVIATNMFFAGETSGVWSYGLWPHSWTLGGGVNVGTAANPMMVNAYQVTNINSASPVIGTFIHENGHLLLDYPDLYDTIGEGVGQHCLMGSGNHLNNGRTPAPINAFLKDMVGWAKITEIDKDSSIVAQLPATRNVAYRHENPKDDNESFYMEYRGRTDRWAAHCPDLGLAIWHVDAAVDGNILPPAHYMVSLEQADNRNDLENGSNRGDAGDLFDNSNGLFSDQTKQSARWWAGNRSRLRVEVKGGLQNKLEVQFGELPPNTILVGTPSGGELVYVDSTMRIKWDASIVGDVKIELLKDGAPLSVIAEAAPDTGAYNWQIDQATPPGTGYAIRISSVSNPVPATDDSNGTFEISGASFPPSKAMPYGWFRSKGAKSNWSVVKTNPYEGKFCLGSDKVADARQAGIAYESVFKAGEVSFYLRVSSEQGYDGLTFYVDGVAQPLRNNGLNTLVSGEVPWTFFSFPLSQGRHTLEWVYSKDDSYKSGLDRAWIDAVALPQTLEKLTVRNSSGSLQGSGTEMKFPKVRIGSSSKQATFTITNKGRADLHDLRFRVVGANAKDFSVEALKVKALRPGKSAPLKVRFKPSTAGNKVAMIRVLSSDARRASFDIKLRGTALGLPRMAVSRPSGAKVESGGDVNFGFATVREAGVSKSFLITNTGSAPMKGIKIIGSGRDSGDFVANGLGSRVLLPKESTTFRVTFKPTKKNTRRAALLIRTTDGFTDQFRIDVRGVGVPSDVRRVIASSDGTPVMLGSALDGTASAVSAASSKVAVNGLKYLALTVEKPAAGYAPVIEVSPNLIDWFSGPRHTTVLGDNERFLKVRDNTPVGNGVKRYIRVKAD